MPGNENKTQVGSRTGGENKRRRGEEEMVVVCVGDAAELRGREYYPFPC